MNQFQTIYNEMIFFRIHNDTVKIENTAFEIVNITVFILYTHAFFIAFFNKMCNFKVCRSDNSLVPEGIFLPFEVRYDSPRLFAYDNPGCYIPEISRSHDRAVRFAHCGVRKIKASRTEHSYFSYFGIQKSHRVVLSFCNGGVHMRIIAHTCYDVI